VLRFCFLISLLLLLLLSLTACVAPAWTSRPWEYGDVRALDAPDAPSPPVDILAVYLRRNALDIEIRVDLLDLDQAEKDEYLLQVMLWDGQQLRQATPLVITIPATRPVRASGPFPITPRVVRDPWLDTVTIRLNAVHLGRDIRVDVATFLPPGREPADRVTGVRLNALPPPRAPLLLAFWDSFPAVTPAQALRRWDGAHTGPGGGRHGLRYVLDNAERYGIPVALLDLRTPSSLAAFNFLTGTKQLQRLLNRRLLMLPEVAYSEPVDVALAFGRRASLALGLPSSPFLYAPADRSLPLSVNRFLPMTEDTHLFLQGIPLPRRAPETQITPDGLTLEVRRALLETALSPDETDVVVLGGSLMESEWGSAESTAAAFAWIAAHPWIWALSGEDVLTFPRQSMGTVSWPADATQRAYPLYTTSAQRLPFDSLTLQATLRRELRAAPSNAVTESAWELYLNLTAPTSDGRLAALRAQYLGLVGDLLAAARWAESPSVISACNTDIDYDGEAECLLTNAAFFAVLEADGARLTFLFWRDGQTIHQLVGPGAQFAQAMSDPSLWQFERGPAADPGVVPGGFVDVDAPCASYHVTSVAASELGFISPDGTRRKTFRITEGAVEMQLRTSAPVTVLLPLAVEPASFFFGGAQYRGRLTSDYWQWGVSGGPEVIVQTDAPFTAHGFNASWPLLTVPENPDLDYPTGHYYPFPLALVRWNGERDFSVRLRPVP